MIYFFSFIFHELSQSPPSFFFLGQTCSALRTYHFTSCQYLTIFIKILSGYKTEPRIVQVNLYFNITCVCLCAVGKVPTSPERVLYTTANHTSTTTKKNLIKIYKLNFESLCIFSQFSLNPSISSCLYIRRKCSLLKLKMTYTYVLYLCVV